MRKSLSLWAPVAFVSLGHFIPLRDFDAFWHLLIGEEIVRTGSIPATDSYSFTFRGQPSTYPDWLGDLLLGVTHIISGITGVQFLIALIFGLIYWSSIRRARLIHSRLTWSLAIALSLFFCLFRFTSARPQSFAFLLCSLVLYQWTKWKESRSTLTLYSIPFLILIWSNLHRSAYVGFLLLFVSFLFEERTFRKKFLTALSLSAVALFLRPYSLDIFGTVVDLFTSQEMHQTVTEWQGLSLGLLAVGYFPLAIAWIFLIYRIVRSPEESLHSPPLIIGTLLSIGGIWFHRFLPFAAIFLIPEQIDWLSNRHRSFRDLLFTRGYISALSLVLLLSWIHPSWAGPLRSFPLGFGIESGIPVVEARFIRDRLRSARLYNQLGDGGILLWESKGKTQVFIDGRTATLYPFSFVQEAANTLASRESWNQAVRRYDIDAAILPAVAPDRFNTALSSESSWPVVFIGDQRVVHVRADRLDQHRDLFAFREIDWEDPFPSLLKLHSKSDLWVKTRRAMDKMASYSPTLFKSSVLSAFMAHLDGDIVGQKKWLTQAVTANPEYEFGRVQLKTLKGN